MIIYLKTNFKYLLLKIVILKVKNKLLLLDNELLRNS